MMKQLAPYDESASGSTAAHTQAVRKKVAEESY